MPQVGSQGGRRGHTSTQRETNGVGKPNGEKGACDRCRGQKLKCVWDSRGEGPGQRCQRCQRADALCTVPSPRPMGRPPRQHQRVASSQASSASVQSFDPHNDANDTFSWPDDSNGSNLTLPSSTYGSEDSMTSAALPDQNDSFDFLNFFPDTVTSTGFFSGGFMSPTGLAASHSLPSLNNGTSTTDFSPQPLQDFSTAIGLLPQINNDGRDMHTDDMAMSIDKEPDSPVKLLAQLCNLNVALFQHPLYREKEKLKQRSHSEGINKAGGNDDLTLSDLGIGKLLEMTYQLKTLVTSMRALEDAQSTGKETLDASTALMALSCYTRFDTLFGRAIETLRRVRNRTQHLSDIHQLIPNLAIDGFAMDKCYDLHLDFILHLCENFHEKIRNCVRSGERALASKT